MQEQIESKWTEEYFNEVFEKFLRESPDMVYWRAYEAVEILHVAKFGKTRYSSYDSFRNCRKKMLFGT